MKHFEKILFFYSIVAITAFFITSALFNPNPQNFIAGVLLLPILLFFWLRVTNPKEVNLTKWSLRLVVSILVVSALGIYTTFLSTYLPGGTKQEEKDATELETIQKIEELKKDIESLRENQSSSEVTDEFDQIRDELALICSNNSSESDLAGLILETDKEEIVLGYISVTNDLIDEVEVLKENDFASKKIGSIKYGDKFPYTQTAGNWYKIVLSDDIQGWVHERDVKETNEKE